MTYTYIVWCLNVTIFKKFWKLTAINRLILNSKIPLNVTIFQMRAFEKLLGWKFPMLSIELDLFVKRFDLIINNKGMVQIVVS